MKLEAVTRTEDSKMDSKEPAAEQQVESTNHGLNGKGVENGNGHGTSDVVSQNGDVKGKQISKSCVTKTDVQDDASEDSSKDDVSCTVSDKSGVAGEKDTSESDSKLVSEISSDKTGNTPGEIKDKVSDKKNVSASEVAISEPVDTDSSEKASKRQEIRSEKKADDETSQENDITESRSENKMNEVSRDVTQSANRKETVGSVDDAPKLESDIPSPSGSSKEKKTGAQVKVVDADNDLEKVKSGGLTMKLDSGEEFSVQLAEDDDEAEEEVKSNSKTTEDNSDDDVTLVTVESKPKPKAEIHVTYSGTTATSTTVQARSIAPALSKKTVSMIQASLGAKVPTLITAAPVVAGAGNVIQAGGGNLFVPVQFPSTLKPGQQMATVPVIVNSTIAGVVPNIGQQVSSVKTLAAPGLKPAQTVQATIDPVALANYEKAKVAHGQKVQDYEKLSSFLNDMRSKVTVKNTVDALRSHVVKLPEYRRAEAAKRKALAWKTDPANAPDVSSETDREKCATPVVDADSAEKVDSESTDIEDSTENKAVDDAESTDVEMKDADEDSTCSKVEKDDETKNKDEVNKDGKAGEIKNGKEDTAIDAEKDPAADSEKIPAADPEVTTKTAADTGKDSAKLANAEDSAKPPADDEIDSTKPTADAEKNSGKTTPDVEKDSAKPAADAEKKEGEADQSKTDGKAGKKEVQNEDESKDEGMTEAPPGEKGDHEEAAKKLRPVARFLYYGGLDLAREYIYKDLLDKQEPLLDAKKLTFGEEEDYWRLRRIYSTYRRKNKSMHPKVKKCRSCTFQSESANAMHYHQEHGHVDLTNGRYECALCDFDSRAASAFKFHMEAEHTMVGRVTIKPCFWHCDLCPYEHNNKAMVIKHKMKCGKKFDIKKHLFPTYDDINFLFRALPGPSIGTNPALTPPAAPKPAGSSWSTVGPKPAYNKSYNSLPTTYATTSTLKPQVPQVVTYMTSNGPVRVQLNQAKPVPQLPVTGSRPTLVKQLSSNTSHAPATSILGKRLAAPATVPTPPAKVARSELEICEICGGFIKDRHSLRLHFKMAHCIEIDEAVITAKHSGPPLSCDICMKRFWTFQGLTMHRVAMNHIPQTNTKSIRGSKCFICSVFVADIMKHINSTHNMIPGQLNTIRICPVCGHHMSPGTLVSHLKNLHYMVLPVPTVGVPGQVVATTLAAATAPTSADTKKVYSCTLCKRSFISLQTLNSHINQCHSYKCHLCDFRCTAIEVYKNHIRKGHKKTARQCIICKKNFLGAAYTVHVLKDHCRKLSVKLERCDHLVDLFKGVSSSSKSQAGTSTSK